MPSSSSHPSFTISTGGGKPYGGRSRLIGRQSPVGMSPYFWPDIPYSALTHFYKAFLPMAYFTMRGIHSRSAASAFLTSTVSDIRAASGHPGFPVHLIGGLSGAMGREATAGFMRAVEQTKMLGFSLYAFDQTKPAVWRALSRRS